MDDTPPTVESAQEDDNSDTLIVPPPNFRERLLAAQRARANEVRPSLAIPMHQRDTQTMPRVKFPRTASKPLEAPSTQETPTPPADRDDDPPRS